MLLVRHSVPEIDPAQPAEEWPLNEEGRRRCAPLAARLRPYEPTAIVASTEPKARETAALVGLDLGLEVVESDALRETARRTVPWLEADELRRAVRVLFEQPEEVVFGEESGSGALARFTAALDGLDEQTVVVSHGTVISLYAASLTGGDAYAIWSRLELPDLVVV